ncbi:hypothetical protein RJ641_020607 [Dillenia turbinata]|uniref:Uncharacterized protein n=1 Tax=Dillenia turbinata TaxID=194707 RepID=A0AAN8UHA9_9MAGN
MRSFLLLATGNQLKVLAAQKTRPRNVASASETRVDEGDTTGTAAVLLRMVDQNKVLNEVNFDQWLETLVQHMLKRRRWDPSRQSFSKPCGGGGGGGGAHGCSLVVAMRPGGPGPPGWGPGPGGPPGPFGGFCNLISSCLGFLCCCWLLRDCFGGPLGPPGPPGPGPFGGPPGPP